MLYYFIFLGLFAARKVLDQCRSKRNVCRLQEQRQTTLVVVTHDRRFITPDDQSKDLFAHHSAIVGEGYRSLTEGAKVSYEAEAGDKGPKAVNIQTI